MSFNLGAIADKLLPFDPTPGFNISRGSNDNNNTLPVIAASGTKTPLGQGNKNTPSTSQPGNNSTQKDNNPNPDPYTPSGNVLGASTNTAASKAQAQQDAADLALLDDKEGLLRALLSRTGTSLDQGLTQIGDDYNKETSRANAQEGQTLQDFATKREDTTNAHNSALDQVDTHARTLANSVRQLIGRASGSGSSAYQVTAPGAIARDASLERQGTQETFGRNFRDLATGEQRAKSSFEQLLSDLADQKNQKEKGLREGILTQEQDVQGQLGDIARNRTALKGGNYAAIRAASAPAQAEVASRQAQIDSLFDRFRTPYQVQAVDTSTPNLSDYTYDKSAVNAQSQGGGTTVGAQYSPYAKFLQKDDENKYGF